MNSLALPLSLPVPSRSVSSVGLDCFCFFVGLTIEATEIRKLLRHFVNAFPDLSSTVNPFSHIIVSPMFTTNATLSLLRAWRFGQPIPFADSPVPKLSTLAFDSGGYQVQIGRIGYSDLCDKLLDCYRQHDYADLYVLPDHVPSSRDSDAKVESKITETLKVGEKFIAALTSIAERGAFLGVVHGRSVKQVVACVRAWASLGIRYIGFGSLPSSGRNYGAMTLSKETLTLLCAIDDERRSLSLSFHLFGVGSPSLLFRLAFNGIVVVSFDSTAFFKAGGFGRVFLPLPNCNQIPMSNRGDGNLTAFLALKRQSSHNCPFCDDVNMLRRSRWHRILHNLLVTSQVAETLRSASVAMASVR